MIKNKSFEFEKFMLLREINNKQSSNIFIILKVNYIENKLIVQYYISSQEKKITEVWNLEETIQKINEFKLEIYELKTEIE